MYYVELDVDGRVTRLEYIINTRINELDLSKGFFIESFPTPEESTNTIATLYGDITTKEVWYEYKQIKTPEEKTSETEQRLSDLEIAVASLLGGAE